MEKIVATVKAYKSPCSEIVVIPKEIRRYIGHSNGKRFLVKVDGKGRIIYEPIPEEFEEDPKK